MHCPVNLPVTGGGPTVALLALALVLTGGVLLTCRRHTRGPAMLIAIGLVATAVVLLPTQTAAATPRCPAPPTRPAPAPTTTTPDTSTTAQVTSTTTSSATTTTAPTPVPPTTTSATSTTTPTSAPSTTVEAATTTALAPSTTAAGTINATISGTYMRFGRKLDSTATPPGHFDTLPSDEPCPPLSDPLVCWSPGGTADDSGPNANLTMRLTNVETGVAQTTRTGPDGSYSFIITVPGDYQVEVVDLPQDRSGTFTWTWETDDTPPEPSMLSITFLTWMLQYGGTVLHLEDGDAYTGIDFQVGNQRGGGDNP